MQEHRIRLTDADITLIVAALRARLAMTTAARKHRTARLIERLEDGGRGNPQLRLSRESQLQEL